MLPRKTAVQNNASDAQGEAHTLQWIVVALDSIEMITVPWWFWNASGREERGLTNWMDKRLARRRPLTGIRQM